jgi:hypothetical protein
MDLRQKIVTWRYLWGLHPGAEKGKPLLLGTYTLPMYLTATVQGHLSRSLEGVKAYMALSIRIMIRRR